mgnify:CR=1 FL=1
MKIKKVLEHNIPLDIIKKCVEENKTKKDVKYEEQERN